MTVTVYLPQDMSALRDEIALLHAEAAAMQVQRLACPAEQKRAVLRVVGEGTAVMAPKPVMACSISRMESPPVPLLLYHFRAANASKIT